MTEKSKPTIFDIGSKFSRAGFSGDSSPYLISHTFLGIAKYVCSIYPVKLYYFGSDAYSKIRLMQPYYPVQRGIISDWENMDIYLQFLFEQLRINANEHPVLFTETSFNPKANREQLIEIMFEKYNVPSFFIENQAVLSLLSSGRKTGIVVETGDEITNIVPIYEGYPIHHAIKRMNLGGSSITNELTKILEKKQIELDSFTSKEFINEIKEKHCFISYDYDNDLKIADMTNKYDQNVSYIGNNYNNHDFSINKERFMCTEILFQPKYGGDVSNGIHNEIFNSIKKCDQDIQNILFSNIVLSGGNSMFDGFSERITKEINGIMKNNDISVNVICPEGRKNGAWIGGSIFSSNELFSKMVINRNEYDEVGGQIVHIKCI